MTDTLPERLRAYAEVNDQLGHYTEAKCLYESADEIERLRHSLERVLLDIKFMTESDVLPAHILDDVIYQNALERMTKDFLKEFNGE